MIRKTLLPLCMAIALSLALLPIEAQAKDPYVKTSKGAYVHPLKTNKTYKKYDITGDGVPDKIHIKADTSASDSISWLKVYVNGKKSLSVVYNADPATKENDLFRAFPSLKYVRLSNKVPYLYIHFFSNNGYYRGGWLYHYSGKKLKAAYDTADLVKACIASHPNPWHAFENLKEVNKNNLVFEVGSTTTETINYTLRYKNGKLKLK